MSVRSKGRLVIVSFVAVTAAVAIVLVMRDPAGPLCVAATVRAAADPGCARFRVEPPPPGCPADPHAGRRPDPVPR